MTDTDSCRNDVSLLDEGRQLAAEGVHGKTHDVEVVTINTRHKAPAHLLRAHRRLSVSIIKPSW